MRKYKDLMIQTDLRELRLLADHYHELEKEYCAVLDTQARAARLKFKADCEVFRLECEQKKTAQAMQNLIWKKILAPEDYCC